MVSTSELAKLSLEAKGEIGEVDEIIPQQLEELKKNLEENYKNLKLPPNPDEFLLRFLRARKFDISRAAKHCSDYLKLIHQLHAINHLFLPKNIEWTYRDRMVSALRKRDSKGVLVLNLRHEFLPPSPDWVDIVLSSLFVLMDFSHRISVDTQRIGVHLLIDLKCHSFAHIRHINPFRVIQAVKLLTGAVPARIKGLHFVRNPEAFNYIFSIAKPFFPKKIKSRIYFHGYDFDSLHQFIEPEILPDHLGGKLEDKDYADLDIISKLVEDNFMDELLKFGYS